MSPEDLLLLSNTIYCRRLIHQLSASSHLVASSRAEAAGASSPHLRKLWVADIR